MSSYTCLSVHAAWSRQPRPSKNVVRRARSPGANDTNLGGRAVVYKSGRDEWWIEWNEEDMVTGVVVVVVVVVVVGIVVVVDIVIDNVDVVGNIVVVVIPVVVVDDVLNDVDSGVYFISRKNLFSKIFQIKFFYHYLCNTTRIRLITSVTSIVVWTKITIQTSIIQLFKLKRLKNQTDKKYKNYETISRITESHGWTFRSIINVTRCYVLRCRRKITS